MQQSKLEMVMSLVDQYTKPMKGVIAQTQALAEKTKGAQQALNSLQSQGKQAEKFDRLKAELGQTEQAFATAKSKAEALKKELNAQQKPTKKLISEHAQAVKVLDRLGRKQDTEKQKLEALSQELKKSGFATEEFSNQSKLLSERTKHATQALEQQQKALEAARIEQQKIEGLKSKSSDLARSAGGDALALGGTLYAAKSLVQAYGEIGSAQGEIASLGIDSDGIKAITEQARAFSSEWAGTTAPEFISASYDIKSGISSLSDEAVGEFTRIAALTATGTKATVAQMTDLFASGYAIYREQFNEFGSSTINDWERLDQSAKDMKFAEYLSSGIASSVQAFKTDGGKLAQFVQTLGASATQAGQTFNEQLAIGGLLSSVFQGGQAATKYASFLASAGAASQKLGLDFHDANGNLESTSTILTRLKDKYGDTLDDIEKQELKKAFGTKEAVDMIDVLLPKVGELQSAAQSMQTSLQGGMGTTLAMAEAIGKGTGESLEILDQRLFNTAASLGRVLAPSLLMISAAVGDAANAFANLLDEFPLLSKAIATAFTAFVAYKSVMIGVKLALAGLASAKAFYASVTNLAALATIRHKAVMIASAVGTKAMAAAQWALNAAMLANPIGLIIAGITALGAAIAGILAYWDDIKAFFGFFGDDNDVSINKSSTSKTINETSLTTPSLEDAKGSIINGRLNSSPNGGYTDNKTININVEKLPANIDEAKLASEINRQMAERESQQERSMRGSFAM